MTTQAEQDDQLPPTPLPVVREGEYEGGTYRIETHHEPEEL